MTTDQTTQPTIEPTTEPTTRVFTATDPAVVEWLTCGVFTINVHGTLEADPAVMSWLRTMNGANR